MFRYALLAGLISLSSACASSGSSVSDDSPPDPYPDWMVVLPRDHLRTCDYLTLTTLWYKAKGRPLEGMPSDFIETDETVRRQRWQSRRQSIQTVYVESQADAVIDAAYGFAIPDRYDFIVFTDPDCRE